MHDSWELLNRDPNGGGKRNREHWPQPQGYLDLGGHIVSGVVSPKDASPSNMA